MDYVIDCLKGNEKTCCCSIQVMDKTVYTGTLIDTKRIERRAHKQTDNTGASSQATTHALVHTCIELKTTTTTTKNDSRIE